ncbi:MAG: hypothetical protein ISS72_07485 [Candidatus Brocadiae bacterium]|nr:hypothetical protein [Candidatus Brocadiia bacterium]
MTSLVSPATRLLAKEEKATNCPSGLMAQRCELSFPCVPSEAMLTRVVVASCASKTKMSLLPFVSPSTMSLPLEKKVTRRPSALIAPTPEKSLGRRPVSALLASIVFPVSRSWR